MKEYHTSIQIDQPIKAVWDFLTDFEKYPEWNPLVGELTGELIEGATIKTYIRPLAKAFYPILLSVKQGSEIEWQGFQGAKFLLAGRHYYRLKSLDAQRTQLDHGEYFTGLFSFFISPSLLKKMEDTFIHHNETLKRLLENEK